MLLSSWSKTALLLLLAQGFLENSGAAGSSLLKAAAPPPRRLTPAELEIYNRDGVVLVKGLLTPAELEAAQAASSELLSSNERAIPAYRLVNFQGWRSSRALRTVAMHSAAPGVAAQVVMGRGQEGVGEGEAVGGEEKGRPRRLRLLKDALLAFSPGDQGCDWHCDDKVFWPTQDVPVGSAREGCNVWIALTPVRAADGGGLAVAPGSFRAPWREEAQAAIRFELGKEPPATCDMAKRSPASRARLERAKALHDMEPGDALVHARYCFHRGEPFRAAPEESGQLCRVAYSVRYEPDDAVLYPSPLEGAICAGRASGGDAIRKAGGYYPQVWPRPNPLERLAIAAGRVKADPSLFRGGKK